MKNLLLVLCCFMLNLIAFSQELEPLEIKVFRGDTIRLHAAPSGEASSIFWQRSEDGKIWHVIEGETGGILEVVVDSAIYYQPGIYDRDKCFYQVGQLASISVREPNSVTDYDGNTYKTTKVGRQLWMTENLRVTHYANGDPIPKSELFWFLHDSSLYAEKYGAYYTGVAAMNGGAYNPNVKTVIQGACPADWHIPSSSEWKNFIDFGVHEEVIYQSKGSHYLSSSKLSRKLGFFLDNAGYILPSSIPDNEFFYTKENPDDHANRFWSSTKNNESENEIWEKATINYLDWYPLGNEASWSIGIYKSNLEAMSVRCISNDEIRLPSMLLPRTPFDLKVKTGFETQLAWQKDEEDTLTFDYKVVLVDSLQRRLEFELYDNTITLQLPNNSTYRWYVVARNFNRDSTVSSLDTFRVSYPDFNTQFGYVSDIDNNQYKTVKIGDQIWMAENMRVTRYENGQSLVLGQSKSDSTRYYYWYNNDSSKYASSYGALYNWPGASYSSEASIEIVQGICPTGWKIPTSSDWIKLRNAIPDGNVDYLKSTSDWFNNHNGNNFTGFSALPAGERTRFFKDDKERTTFWSSSIGQTYFYIVNASISYDDESLRLNEYEDGTSGRSVRCIKQDKRSIGSQPSFLNTFSPITGDIVRDTPITLRWNAVDSDSISGRLSYDLYFGTKTDLPLYVSELQKNEYEFVNALEEQTYYWKVSATDPSGNIIISEIRSFQVDYPENTAPTLTILKQPADTIKTSSASLKWASKDNENNIVKYDIYYGNQDQLKILESNTSLTTVDLEDLEGNTTYRWVITAFDDAVKEGRVWSDTGTFYVKDTLHYASVSDIEGNFYRTVRINGIEWMTENLRSTRYGNGIEVDQKDPIPRGGHALFNNEKLFIKKNGELYYTWNAANDRDFDQKNLEPTIIQGVCPAGWRLPHVEDFRSLLAAVDSKSKELTIAIDKNSPHCFGFCSEPFGLNGDGGSGTGEFSAYWTANSQDEHKAYFALLGINEVVSEKLIKNAQKGYFLNIRCVRDLEETAQKE